MARAAVPEKPPLDVRARIDAFVEAFNVNDLDRVMTFFAEDAVYRPGNGKEHRGKAEIRRAFEPQFNGAFGKMRFDEIDRLVDEPARKATIRWICRHDLRGEYGAKVPAPMRLLYRVLFRGEQAGWRGLDVFHFDEDGLLVGKFSHGESSGRPRLERELGVPL